MVLLQGVLLARYLHLPRVILESDALAAIQAINDKSTGSSSGHLIQEILQIRSSFESCTFQHICREFNQVAHELANMLAGQKTPTYGRVLLLLFLC